MKVYKLVVFLSLTFSCLPFHAFLQSNTIIGEPTINEYGLSICADDFGNTIVGGTRGNDALVVKQDASNNIIWSKKMSFSTNAQNVSEIGFIDVLADTIFGCGWISNGNSIGGAVYFKLNAQTGVPYWIKAAGASLSCFSTMRYSNGIYLLVAAVQESGGDRDGKVIAVSSQSGQVIWETPTLSLKFPPNTADHLDDFTAASEIVNGKLFITGRSYVNGASSLDMRALLIGVDVTGNIFLKKYLLFDIAGTNVNRFYGFRIEYEGTDSLVVAYTGDDNCTTCSDFKSGLLKCDLQGNVKFAKYYDIQGVTGEFVRTFNRTSTGYVMYGQVNTGTSTMRLYVTKTDKQGNVIDCKLIAPPSGVYTTYCGVGNYAAGNNDYANGTHYFVATTYTTNANLRDIKKILLDDNLNNPSDCSTNLSTTVTTTSFTPFSGQLISLDIPIPFVFNPVSSSVNIVIPTQCGSNQLTISTSNFCDSMQFIAQLVGVNNVNYVWSNGHVGNSLTVGSADSIFLSVTNPLNCCVYYDTIVPVIAVNQPLTVSLPADTILCLTLGQVFNMDASLLNSSGLIDYQWSGGALVTNVATVSPLPVNSSGIYWLTVSDDCATVSDTIEITVSLPPTIAIDSLFTICTSNFPLILSPTISNEDTFSWSDGTTSNDLSVNIPGFYTINATNTCGSTSEEIEVASISFPVVDLIPIIDTCISIGSEITLTAIVQNSSDFLWNTGDQGLTINTSISGDYWISATNDCGTVSDTSNVTINYLPSITNAISYTVCEDDYPLLVDPIITNATSVSWSDGILTASRTIDQSGNYTIYATNNCGIDSLTIEVSTILLPIVSMQSIIDTCVANGSSVPLIPVLTDVTTLEWSNGNATNQLLVASSGTYWVIGSNQCGADTSSIEVIINYFPELYLPELLDTCFEIGIGFNYTAQGTGGNYSWSSGSTNATELITQEGLYTCTLTNQCGSVSDSMDVNQMAAIDLYIPKDSLLFCANEVSLSSLGIETNYEMEVSNDQGQSISALLNETGWYSIHAYNVCGFVDDSIYVDLQEEQYFYLPNSFTPDGDERNPLFIDKGYNYVIEKVELFNRWGELIYEESGNFSGWDGTYKGNVCPDGIYQVHVIYWNCAGIETQFYGHVTLIK